MPSKNPYDKQIPSTPKKKYSHLTNTGEGIFSTDYTLNQVKQKLAPLASSYLPDLEKGFIQGIRKVKYDIKTFLS